MPDKDRILSMLLSPDPEMNLLGRELVLRHSKNMKDWDRIELLINSDDKECLKICEYVLKRQKKTLENLEKLRQRVFLDIEYVTEKSTLGNWNHVTPKDIKVTPTTGWVLYRKIEEYYKKIKKTKNFLEEENYYGVLYKRNEELRNEAYNKKY